MRIYESYVQLNVLAYRGHIEWDLTMRKKLAYQVLVVALKKKKLQTFYHFSRLTLYFPDFSKNSKVQDQPWHYLCLQK